MVIYVIVFAVELLKYWYTYKVIFNGKIKNKKIVPVAIVAIMLYIIGTGLLRPDADTMYLIMYICVILIMGITVDEKKSRKILDILILFCIISGLDEIFSIILKKLFLHSSIFLDERTANLMLASLFTFAIVGCVQLIKKFFFQNKSEKWSKLIRESIYLVVFFIIICMLFTTATLTYLRKFLEDRRELFNLLTTTSVLSYLGICVLSFLVVYIKQSNEKLENIAESESELKKVQQKFYVNLLDKEDETRRFRHDINNHLICLRRLGEKEDWQKVKVYIDSMQEQVNEINKTEKYTGNDILDAMLNHYVISAQAKIDLSVTGKCMNAMAISDYDACTIFSNLIQNAVEALALETGNEKKLEIHIVSGSKHIKIQFINSCTVNIDKIAKQMLTKKKDKINHGLGLKNVMETVEKNDGKFIYKKENDTFISEVTLHIK